MRLLQLIQKPQRRGAEIFAEQLSAELCRRGHTVARVFLYPHDGEARLEPWPEDLELRGDEAHWSERLLGARPGLLVRLGRAIGRFRPDVVQANGARTLKYSALAKRIAVGRKWKLVYRNIGNPADWMGSARQRAFYSKLVMPALDGIVGVSKATLAQVVDAYGLSIPTIHIPRGIDPDSFSHSATAWETRRQLSTPEEAVVVLFVGSLSREKRVDRFLRVLAGASEQFGPLVGWIVGEGPLRKELEDQATALGIQDRTWFTGGVNDVGPYLQAADLFLLTSDTEGMPGVLLEAGLFGLPVVATKVGGVSECVEDGVTGLLYDPGKEEAFLEGVIRLATQRQLRQTMGEKSAERVRKRYTIDRIARAYLAFYSSLLSKPP